MKTPFLFRGEIPESLLLHHPLKERAEVSAKPLQIAPYRFLACCDILRLQQFRLFIGEEYSILLAAIRVVNERMAKIRAIIVIRQHDEIREFSKEPDYRIRAALIPPRSNRDRVLVRSLLARLQVTRISEEPRNAFGLTLDDELSHLPERFACGDSYADKTREANIRNLRYCAQALLRTDDHEIAANMHFRRYRIPRSRLNQLLALLFRLLT